MSFGVELHVTLSFVWFIETVSVTLWIVANTTKPDDGGEGHKQVSNRSCVTGAKNAPAS